MMLMSTNIVNNTIFSVRVETNNSKVFSITYKGSMKVHFGDNTKEQLLTSASETTYSHTYTS